MSDASYWRNVAQTYQNLYEFEVSDHYITRQLLWETGEEERVSRKSFRYWREVIFNRESLAKTTLYLLAFLPAWFVGPESSWWLVFAAALWMTFVMDVYASLRGVPPRSQG